MILRLDQDGDGGPTIKYMDLVATRHPGEWTCIWVEEIPLFVEPNVKDSPNERTKEYELLRYYILFDQVRYKEILGWTPGKVVLVTGKRKVLPFEELWAEIENDKSIPESERELVLEAVVHTTFRLGDFDEIGALPVDHEGALKC